MPDNISRRDSLKSLGIIVGGTFFPWSTDARNEHGEPLLLPDQAKPFTGTRPVTAITLGAGSRGNVYGDYAATYREQLKIVGVAEPIPIRQERYSRKHAIAADNRFVTWEHVFRRPKFADAIIITTPDNLHYGPCMDALRMGYDVLLEKPISPSERECRDILALTRKSGRIVAVCHVLRYAPYFVKMRDLLRSGAIGRVISVQHMEPIEHTHMAHSFVRGNWHDSKKTTPILLAKSCHDLDILRWMVDSESRQIQAFGDLAWFKSANAPAGSTARCLDGCAVEKTCPYSAKRIYYDKRERLYVFDLPEAEAEKGPAILEYLRTTELRPMRLSDGKRSARSLCGEHGLRQRRHRELQHGSVFTVGRPPHARDGQHGLHRRRHGSYGCLRLPHRRQRRPTRAPRLMSINMPATVMAGATGAWLPIGCAQSRHRTPRF